MLGFDDWRKLNPSDVLWESGPLGSVQIQVETTPDVYTCADFKQVTFQARDLDTNNGIRYLATDTYFHYEPTLYWYKAYV